MSQDPFEQFERSRGGLLIPILVFAVGALVTVVAIKTLQDLRIRENAELQALEQAMEPINDPTKGRVVDPDLNGEPAPNQDEQKTTSDEAART
ncbi:MAG: hypothetical protein ACR2NZ_25810 [Rubripirellula sp.]